jgi:hypothetical protein
MRIKLVVAVQRGVVDMLQMFARAIRDRDSARAGDRAAFGKAGVDAVAAFDILLAGVELVEADGIAGIEGVVQPGMQSFANQGGRVLIAIEIRQSGGVILLRLVVLRDEKVGRSSFDILVIRGQQQAGLLLKEAASPGDTAQGIGCGVEVTEGKIGFRKIVAGRQVGRAM